MTDAPRVAALKAAKDFLVLENTALDKAGAEYLPDCVKVVIDQIDAALSSPPPGAGVVEVKVPADVRRLVIAARKVAFDDPVVEDFKELDAASEAFASRVPWEDAP
jgi:hypothetical protein